MKVHKNYVEKSCFKNLSICSTLSSKTPISLKAFTVVCPRGRRLHTEILDSEESKCVDDMTAQWQLINHYDQVDSIQKASIPDRIDFAILIKTRMKRNNHHIAPEEFHITSQAINYKM